MDKKLLQFAKDIAPAVAIVVLTITTFILGIRDTSIQDLYKKAELNRIEIENTQEKIKRLSYTKNV